MDKKTKKAISKNRVKILGLDYFDLTAPLLAAEVLPTKKHKEIKTEASTNKARIDLLLEWIDEMASEDAFQPFLQGIRNCQENMLAKKIKKEAVDGEAPKKVQRPNKPMVSGSTTPGIGGLNIPGLSVDKSKSNKTPKTKSKKTKDDQGVKPQVSALGNLTLPINLFNGLGSMLPPPVSTPQSRKRKSGDAKTPGNPNGPSATTASDETKVVTKSGPTAKPKTNKSLPATAAAKLKSVKVKLPKPAIPRKLSTDKAADEQEKKGKTQTPKKKIEAPSAATGAPKSPKAFGKAKSMSFKEVETKQLDSRQKFRFRNSNATAKIIHFKDKTDISYLGCPFEENGKWCEKKVELKSKEFVCESRHKSPNCKQIPRLYVTCSDGTGADLQFTFLKKDVEIFCGKSASELGSLSINEIKEALDATVGKKYAVEVHCEKAKKTAKKAGAPKWNNLATILSSDSDDSSSPAKKKRKN